MAVGIGGATHIDDQSYRPTAVHRLMSAAASDNATVVTTRVTQIQRITGWNAATVSYLKIYDKATAPTSADVPVASIYLPASAAFSLGHDVVPTLQNGLSYRIVAGVADNDNTAVAAAAVLALNLSYRV